MSIVPFPCAEVAACMAAIVGECGDPLDRARTTFALAKALPLDRLLVGWRTSDGAEGPPRVLEFAEVFLPNARGETMAAWIAPTWADAEPDYDVSVGTPEGIDRFLHVGPYVEARHRRLAAEDLLREAWLVPWPDGFDARDRAELALGRAAWDAEQGDSDVAACFACLGVVLLSESAERTPCAALYDLVLVALPEVIDRGTRDHVRATLDVEAYLPDPWEAA